MQRFFKVLGWLFAILFSVSAVLQYNDPDPFLWIFVYGVATFVTVGFVFNSISYIIPLLLGVLCIVGFLYLFPDTFEGFTLGQGDIKNIEEAREAFGLLIIAIVMIAFALRVRYVGRLKV